ncbi:MAG: 2,3-bisphosphoglycerate-independent phosphoglycerate mutase [Clostridia bacterium]
MNKRFTALLILDGFGLRKDTNANAITPKTAPFMFKLMQTRPFSTLEASGLAVGLPEGQMGNSEVGHLNIGAGKVVYQELTRISKSIKDGDFYENEAFLKACDNCKKNNKALHLMGLVSNGGVHSHISHIFALIELAKKQGLKDVYVHCFLDGRDVPPSSAINFVAELYNFMQSIHFGKIASLCGRFYAMDRDNIWERVEKAYSALVDGVGLKYDCAKKALEESYANGITDEFVLPTLITNNGEAFTIKKGDSIIFFNFRPDRARMITRSFIYSDFNNFERKQGFLAPTFVSMTQYDVTFGDKLTVAYKPVANNNTLGEYLSKQGVKQFRIAETQKYAHVTFFFNGGVEAPNPNEQRFLIDSPKIATFDMKPEMSAYEVCERAITEIKSGKFDVMILNFANCDMVGHTGILEAAEKAVTAVDNCVKMLVETIEAVGGQALITADHGNADIMADENGEPFTAHTTNLVPLVLIDKTCANKKLANGKLCDIAPTLLAMMDIAQPAEMTGCNLLK